MEKIEKFRSVLKKYSPNQFLEQNDFITVLELFKTHPSWKKKEGNGIAKIQVIIDKWKNKNYLLHRIDSSTTDISFIIAARGKSDSLKKKLMSACRNAIQQIILEQKDKIKYGIQQCPITNQILTKENTHIDHYDLTFKEVFDKWIKNFDIQELQKKLNDSSKDLVVEDFFIDEEIKKNFVEFHNANTHLRPISTNANLSILRKKGGTTK